MTPAETLERARARRQARVSPSASDSEVPTPPTTEASPAPPRRNGRYSRRTAPPEEQPAVEQHDERGDPEAAPPKPRRARGSRGGKRHRKAAPVVVEPTVEEPETPIQEAPKPASRRRSQPRADTSPKGSPKGVVEEPRTAARRKVRAEPQAPEAYDDVAPEVPKHSLAPKTRIPVTGAPIDVPPPFAHNAEYEFARILDFYGIDWVYEPRSFPLRWERGHVTEAFTPDFYLPDLDLFVELTTLKSGLTAEKNRKMRILNELYPDTNIIMLKKRDYLRLLAKYGYGAISPSQVPDIDRVLIPTTKLQQRVAELGEQISRDYAGKEPVLVGVLRGVMCFISDVMRQISLPTSVDFMSVSSYDGNGATAVRILKDLELNIKGRDVILVEDIVDTGMTLNHVIEYLQTKRPASVKVCTLLDKRARRLINVPIDYVGFEIPDEFVVGYGLDFHQRFRNLPFIGVLKHELLP